jgi:cadmium resistance protein CadD (predicted permease)
MGSYSGTVVIGYGDIFTVCGMLGLVPLMLGLMWYMCQVQHVDVWIFKSRT